jgi:hypothetical protein
MGGVSFPTWPLGFITGGFFLLFCLCVSAGRAAEVQQLSKGLGDWNGAN